MRVAFRADSSARIGFGHIGRCLALAEALVAAGAEVLFVCRDLPGHLSSAAESRGYPVSLLGAPSEAGSGPGHEGWLGAPWQADAEQTAEVLRGWGGVDWLVVDHYALDRHWEECLSDVTRHVLVIDDLADREHACDILLDQNLCPEPAGRYRGLVTDCTRLLLGPKYALMRPEFARARDRKRLRQGAARRILVFFGGADPDNFTERAIEAVGELSGDIRVDVVLGGANPRRQSIEAMCSAMPQVQVHVQVEDFAELMHAADLMVAAGGGNAWERCCLGVPSVTVCVADNQRINCEQLAKRHATIWVGAADEVDGASLGRLLNRLVTRASLLRRLSDRAGALVDGQGAARVAQAMIEGMQSR